jgi:hypothetical protein
MTALQLSVLARAARTDDALPGTALMYEHQAGRNRQVIWLVSQKLCRIRHGRLVATKDGRKVLDYQLTGS